jgi:polysaccharide lyase-like protein
VARLATPLFLTAVVALSLTQVGAGSAPAISFRGDWETGNAKQWSNVQYEFDRPMSKSFALVTSPVRQGKYAAEYIVRQGFSPYGHNESVETGWKTADQGPGTEYYYAWSTLFPVDWVRLPAWGKFIQFFTQRFNLFGGGPPISLDAANNRIELDVRTGRASVKGERASAEYSRTWIVSRTLPLGKWNDFVVHVRWAADRTGLFEAWYRVAGEGGFRRVAYANGIPTLRSNPAYGIDPIGSIKLGLYRKSYCSLPVELRCRSPLGRQETSVVYHDGFTRGSSFATVVNAAFGDRVTGPPPVRSATSG